MSYSKLLKEIMYDEDNISYTEKGIKPLFSAPETAQIIIIAQAPGIRAQELGIFFNDLSGSGQEGFLSFATGRTSAIKRIR